MRIEPRLLSDLIGKTFAPGGRGPQSYDCYGLLKELWRRVHKVELADYPTSDEMQNALQVSIARVTDGWEMLQEPHPGCAVTFRFNCPLSNHCGMVISENEFMHVRRGALVVIEKLNSPIWRHIITGYFVRHDG